MWPEYDDSPQDEEEQSRLNREYAWIMAIVTVAAAGVVIYLGVKVWG